MFHVKHDQTRRPLVALFDYAHRYRTSSLARRLSRLSLMVFTQQSMIKVLITERAQQAVFFH